MVQYSSATVLDSTTVLVILVYTLQVYVQSTGTRPGTVQYLRIQFENTTLRILRMLRIIVLRGNLIIYVL